MNILRPPHNDRHLADDIFKCIFLKEMYVFLKASINNIQALNQRMCLLRSYTELDHIAKCEGLGVFMMEIR